MLDLAKSLSVAGMVFDLAGLLLLFNFAMPARISSREGLHVTWGKPPPDIAKADLRYERLGKLGLALAVAGLGFQIAGTALS